MQFISAQCPHCGKELQLPDDAQQVVCMYCAKPIDVQEVLHAQGIQIPIARCCIRQRN